MKNNTYWFIRKNINLVEIACVLLTVFIGVCWNVQVIDRDKVIEDQKQQIKSLTEQLNTLKDSSISVWYMDKSADAQLRNSGMIQLKIKK